MWGTHWGEVGVTGRGHWATARWDPGAEKGGGNGNAHVRHCGLRFPKSGRPRLCVTETGPGARTGRDAGSVCDGASDRWTSEAAGSGKPLASQGAGHSLFLPHG